MILYTRHVNRLLLNCLRMRIAQIMLGKGFGGAERSFVDTALSLAEQGHAVMAICHERFAEMDQLRGVDNLTVETVNAHGEWDFWTPRQIVRLLADFRAEVIHTQLRRAAWHGAMAGKKLGIPVVSKLHNYVDLARYKNVDRILTTTEDQRAYALSHGWAESSVSVIPNFSRLPAAAVVRAYSTDPLRLLSYGRLVKKKGFDVLLKAFGLLVAGGVDAYLTIGGRGPELEFLRGLTIELGLEARVSVGEWIDCVTTALDQADLFILPSLDEPFGIVILEAMARGVPIISTLTKGPSEVLNDTAAYLVEIGSVDALYDAMQLAATNREDSLKRAESALVRYKEIYFADAVSPRIEAVYRELVSDATG